MNSSLASDEHWDTQRLVGDGWADDARTEPVLSFWLFAVDSDSVGSVAAVSRDPNLLPAVTQPWNTLSAHDTTLLVEAIGVAREISDALGPSLGAELTPGRMTDLPAWVRSIAGGYWHPTSTCKMGPASDPEAVVDSRGRVHGIDGLRVVDASIFPTVPRANTNIPRSRPRSSSRQACGTRPTTAEGSHRPRRSFELVTQTEPTARRC